MDRKLHIGGTTQAEGWEILNALDLPIADHVGNANDLSRFSDNTFTAIYASHIVEHLDYKDELLNALRGWRRVLMPEGVIYISVPDLDVLSELILAKDKLTPDERFFVMRMMFGGHVDQYDYHVVGLNEVFLGSFLRDAGFDAIERVEEFGLFNDTSSMRFKGRLISLNMIARKSGVSDVLTGRATGRNDPCPCGSGQKFKHCHGSLR